MADPLEIPLTHLRRVLVDVAGADWRVAYYHPADAREARKWEEAAARNVPGAKEKLGKIELVRGAGKGPILADALLMAGLGNREAAEVAAYIDGLGSYSRGRRFEPTPEPDPEAVPVPEEPEPEPVPLQPGYVQDRLA